MYFTRPSMDIFIELITPEDDILLRNLFMFTTRFKLEQYIWTLYMIQYT